VPARPVGLKNERLDVCACCGQVDLSHRNRTVAETVAHNEKIMATGFVEAHRPAFAQTVTRESLRSWRLVRRAGLIGFGRRFDAIGSALSPAARCWFLSWPD